MVMIIIGNKADSKRKEVSSEEAQKLSNQLGYPYFEVSALKDIVFSELESYIIDSLVNTIFTPRKVNITKKKLLNYKNKYCSLI